MRPKSKSLHAENQVCLCGLKAIKFRNGWICERCDKFEDVKQDKKKIPRPYWAKYVDEYSIGKPRT